MFTHRPFISLLFASVLGLGLLTTSATARQVDLKVALGTPVLQAGQTQQAVLKVALTGFERETQRSPVNVALVLDRSGSMGGDKLERAKEAAIMAVDRLGPEDTLSIVTYDDVVNVLVPAGYVTNRSSIHRAIRNLRPGGRTALFGGVSRGASEVRKYLSRQRVNRIILLSDGLANVGPSTPTELGQLGASLGKEGISVSTIGLGLGYNEDLMTQLAGFSDGNHAFARTASDLVAIFDQEFNSVLSVVAKDVNIIIHCRPGIRPLRVIGREYEILGDRVTVNLNQLASRQEKFVLLEVEVPPGQPGQHLDLASVDVSYLNLDSQRSDALKHSVGIDFTARPEEVKKNVNKPVLESAIEQKTNEMSKRALGLRDAGRIREAEKVHKDSLDFMDRNLKQFNLPKVQELKKEAEEDSSFFGSAPSAEPQSKAKRKALKERQYKRQNQQLY